MIQIKIIFRSFFTAPSQLLPNGYQETGVQCDSSECRCVIEENCEDSPCIADGRDGICLGIFH